MAIANLTGAGPHTGTFEELTICSPSLTIGIRKELICLSAVNILLSLTAFLGNAVILVALHRESSLHPPSKLLYRCLATTDVCVGLVIHPLAVIYLTSPAHEYWILCRYAYEAGFLTAHALCSVSLLTSTAISVDRLLALLLRLRYRQVVTLKRTYVIVAIFWVVSGFAASCYILNHRITLWYSNIVTPSCLIISIASYSMIFRGLNHHHSQVQDHFQLQPSQLNALNTARYRKAVYSALWVQLTLVICYLPYTTVRVLLIYSGSNSSHFLARLLTMLLIFLNSTLNPFLYCWKISEVRQAVKQTIRQALCCP